jgi:hypothetical protein
VNKDIKQLNNIKLIHSNPWGFGIHSPYVFNLVTKVIFGERHCFNPLSFSIRRNKKMKFRQMILRFIDFLKPDKIIIVGKSASAQPEFSNFAEKFQWIQLPELAGIPEECQSPLVIWHDAPANRDVRLTYQRGACWILNNCKDLKMKEFMIYLRNSEKVRVTIEVNNTGIVIFNENFQKQNYVICDWFLY